MNKKLLSDNKKVKIKLNKVQQLKMLEFFAKTSIPRMLQITSREVD